MRWCGRGLWSGHNTYPDDDLISTSGQEGRRFHTEKQGLSGDVGLGELRPRKEPVRPGGTNVSKPRADDCRRIGETLPAALVPPDPPPAEVAPAAPATVRFVLLPVPTPLVTVPPLPTDEPLDGPTIEPPGPDGVTTFG